ncbi:hypothetical protein D3C80_1960390 [compost metagenome]
MFTFSTSNTEIKSACTLMDSDTMKINPADFIVFQERNYISKEAEKGNITPMPSQEIGLLR